MAGSDKPGSHRLDLARRYRDVADMNAVWDAWVVPGHTPARATMQAKLAGPTHLIEIMVVAAVDQVIACRNVSNNRVRGIP